MLNPEAMLNRLDAIGLALAESEHALALLGLGSVGGERHRLDAFSDLDFFAIVEPGYKQQYLDHLDLWLGRPAPLAYAFRNTEDGYKALYADGIFCEFAVFEPDELARIPFADASIVWQAEHFDPALLQPRTAHENTPEHSVEWCIGEALTNLYIGLGRELRGEHLAALRLIQVHAVNRVLELISLAYVAAPASRDPFAIERRFEQRYPQFLPAYARWTQGYEENRESALAILAFLREHFAVDEAIAQAILTRAQ